MSSDALDEKNMLFSTLRSTVESLRREFSLISQVRKNDLLVLSEFIRAKSDGGQPVNLNFICTHNSRRSHLAQLWAQTAAYIYDVKGVHCYSGGTEATAFNPRAVKAMQDAGFRIVRTTEGDNPIYRVTFSDNAAGIEAFSKKYNDSANPSRDFAAIMTCSHADHNCPLVIGAARRIAITYDDPKDFDGTPEEEQKYRERALQIGREMMFVFSQVHPSSNSSSSFHDDACF